MSQDGSDSDADSLFDDDSEYGGGQEQHSTALLAADGSIPLARRTAPIPGLYLFPALLPPDVASAALATIADADHFAGGQRDQVMLFTAPGSSLPAHIAALDVAVRGLLADRVPAEVLALAFDQALARQAILNLYAPGTGITPHVDLPRRYADGIVGASLAGGCAMTFLRGGQRHDVYLPPRTVYVLSGEARWDWAHGIGYRDTDAVEGGDGREVTMPRSLRVSVTFRWMQEGAGLLA
ncbi:hypothetical protein Q8F55_006809 [Vanrija albida]|uniref:Fe2OG dioxygenase domain-containing protein n=1 Tax=Vanrija albida TaxID=181172 RepID=A0ABR3PYI5_9TREE